MTERETVHQSVLLKETIESLNLSAKGILIDGTLGGGGHSLYALAKYPGVRVIAIDQDETAIQRFQEKFGKEKYKISFHRENFRNLDKVLKEEGIDKVSAIVLDLGLSSDQLENSGRGFSFQKDEPLEMTMQERPSKGDTTAYDIVNSWSEESLADIIYGYGEDKFARRIARSIVAARKIKEIKTTKELVAIIEQAIPARFRKGKIHPATKTFQALRIAVNDELGALEEGLAKGFDSLDGRGRMSVISFHSLEDRIVKRFYKQKQKEKKAILINKKPITAGSAEIKTNPRSRSAKLRVIEKII